LVQPHALALHWCVPRSQHEPAVQSAFEWQHASQAPLVQHLPAPQSASAQHTPVEHVPPQHFLPEPHSASFEQEQEVELHWFVPRSQHWPARQSEFEWQHDWQVPLVQHLPAPQSPSEQQMPLWQIPPQQTRPLPHCAELVQLHTLELH